MDIDRVVESPYCAGRLAMAAGACEKRPCCTMKAIQFSRYGASDVLDLVERDIPVPDSNECLVQVAAAGVNPIDWKVRCGMLRHLLRVKLPFVPGSDVCGVVAQVGPRVKRHRPGDAVFAMVDARRAGCYAQYVSVHEALCSPKPQTLSVDEAAAMPLAGLTALQALRDHGKLSAGQKALVIGASGGVGHYAVQIAKAMGASVTGVCGEANIPMVRELGADRVIDYRQTKLRRVEGRYDVVLDAVAMHSFRQCRHLMAPHAVFVTTLPKLHVLWRMAAMRSRSRARFLLVRPNSADLAFLGNLADQGRLRSIVGKAYPLAQARAAHDASAAGHVRGKLVLHVEATTPMVVGDDVTPRRRPTL